MTGGNPWLRIPAPDYEAHMAEIGQSAALRDIFLQAYADVRPRRLLVLGCTTGRDFEVVDPAVTEKSVGADVNREYLDIGERDGIREPPRVNQIDDINRRANVGYWVRSSATGRGFATTALRQLVGWTFTNTELCRLELVVSVRNGASLRVAEKADAQREGVLKSRLLLHGTFHDAAIFSFVRDREHSTP